MKNRNFIKNSIIPLLPICVGLGVISFSNAPKITEVEAYDSSRLPTTIDLNDLNDSEIRKYYSSLNSLSKDERKGTNLLKNLKGILSNGQKYLNYDSGDSIWRAYEISDRDWNLSPASALTSEQGIYDPVTNTITKYKYGASYSNPYVHAYYVDREVDNPMKAWGNHTQGEGGINREHLWAKSNGFDEGGSSGARGDLFHLVAADGDSNRLHNNTCFGYVDKSKAYELPKFDYASGNSMGISSTLRKGKVFEPQDSDKGDIARALFYMAARYNALDGDTNIDSNNPNLLLSDCAVDYGAPGYPSTPTKPGEYGVLSDLLEWNKLDPVDEYEIHRNNLIYKNFTNNRNPFIDFPEWADMIWGNSTKSASPSTDNINSSISASLTGIEITKNPTKVSYLEEEALDLSGIVVNAIYNDGSKVQVKDFEYNQIDSLAVSDTQITISYHGFTATFAITIAPIDRAIHVTNITLNKTSVELVAGESFKLEAEILPEDATNKNVAWTTSNENIATVKKGFVTTLSAGNVFISATTEDGNLVARCNLTVTEPVVLSSIQFVNISEAVKTFYVGESFTTGALLVNAVYSNGTTNDITDSVVYSGYDLSVEGRQTVYCTYEDFTIEYNIEVFAPVDEDAVIITAHEFDAGNKEVLKEYEIDDVIVSFSKGSGATSPAYYNLGSAARIYGGNTMTISSENWIESIRIHYSTESDSGNTISANVGSFENDLWTGLSKSVTFTVGGTSGHRKVYSIEVKFHEVQLESIALSGEYKTTFNLNDEFDYEGLIVTASYDTKFSATVTLTSITGYNMSAAGNQTVTVSYTENEITKTATYNIEVVVPNFTPKTYAKITSLSELASGASYMIGYENSDKLFALKSNVSASANIVEFTKNTEYTDENNECGIVIDNLTISEGTGTATLKGTNNFSVNSDSSTSFVSTNDPVTIAFDTNGFVEIGNEIRVLLYSAKVNKILCYARSNIGTTNYYKLYLYRELGKTESETSYTLVNDANNLRTGDHVVFVGENNGTYYAPIAQEKQGNFITADEIDVENNSLLLNENTKCFEIVRIENSLLFYDAQYSKYVSWIDSGKSNYIGYNNSNELVDVQFEVTINNGLATINSRVESDRNLLRFTVPSSGDPRFSMYKQNTSSVKFMIFKNDVETSADEWSKTFLRDTVSCSTTLWNSLRNSYNALSTQARDLIQKTTANLDLTASYRAQAMARYDLTVSLARNANVDKFISGRTASSSRPSILGNKDIEKQFPMIVVIISILGLTSISGYYYYKKKQED